MSTVYYPNMTRLPFPAKSLRVLTMQTRTIFFWLFLIVGICAIIGNLFAIRSIIKRKNKILQKTCIISLAIADLFSTLVIAVNSMETFSHELLIWNLGSFLCKFVPMAKIMFTTASATALLVIALDRYQNVIYALSRQWDPNIYICLAFAALLWLYCGVLAYPMTVYFTYYPITVIYNATHTEDAFVCLSSSKEQYKVYYGTLTVLIFVPLLLVFAWFYYHIAMLIWRHRKPLALRFKSEETPPEIDAESGTKSTEVSERLSNEKQLKSIMKKTKNVQVERKIRTLKVIIVLVIAFLICRLPYIINANIELQHKSPNVELVWNLHYSFLVLLVINCSLNVMFYTFLNQTISVCQAIGDFFCKICFCCCSNAEFEDFERENPFIVDNNCEGEQQPSKKGLIPHVRINKKNSLPELRENLKKY